MVVVDRTGVFGWDASDPKGWINVPGARTGRHEQQTGGGITMEEREERHEQ